VPDVNDAAADIFGTPAPSPPYGSALSVFNGTDPQGTWRLFVVDDFDSDSGSIAGGWSLAISLSSGVDYVAGSGTLTFPVGTTVQTVSVTVNGDTAFEPSENFRLSLLDAAGAYILDGDGVGTIGNDDDFTTATLTGALIRAVHIEELRTAVNEARVARGLIAFQFADPTLAAQATPVRAVHISQLREAVNAIYIDAGVTPPPYTDTDMIPGVTPAKAVHILELRAAIRNAP
jgi:hypothetical protein